MANRSASTPPQPETWPFYSPDELEAVARVLVSGKVNYWTGEECRLFEAEYAAASACRHAVAVANGTIALELAIQALEVPPGSEIITSPRTFIASASCAVIRGCIPVLAEIDADSGNITAETIAKVITDKTRAIIVVHLGGWPCEMDPILELAAHHGLKVIEDCAQANGATYKGRPVGSMGHAGAFSFCQDKVITTGGEGGMLVTNDEAVWERAWSFKDHGKNFRSVYHKEHLPGFRWLHDSFGSNGRMLEVQAAIGRRQLSKLQGWIRTRAHHAKTLADGLASLPIARIPLPPAHMQSAWYKFYLYIRPEHLAAGWTRDRILTEITSQGVPCFSGSCSEIYLEKAFANQGLGPAERFPVARELGETSLMFLIHPTLSEETMVRNLEVIRAVLSQASIQK